MKAISILVLTLVMTLLAVTTAKAAPFNAVDLNPNIHAYNTPGPHSIVGILGDFYGEDLVMARGNSGNYHQWFYGTFPPDYETTGGIHTVFNVNKDGSCPDHWISLNGFGWNLGNVEYCAHNNYFHVSK